MLFSPAQMTLRTDGLLHINMITKHRNKQQGVSPEPLLAFPWKKRRRNPMCQHRVAWVACPNTSRRGSVQAGAVTRLEAGNKSVPLNPTAVLRRKAWSTSNLNKKWTERDSLIWQYWEAGRESDRVRDLAGNFYENVYEKDYENVKWKGERKK